MECAAYAPAKAAGKPVFNIEYKAAAFEAACRNQTGFGITSIFKVCAFVFCDEQAIEAVTGCGGCNLRTHPSLHLNSTTKQNLALDSAFWQDCSGANSSAAPAQNAAATLTESIVSQTLGMLLLAQCMIAWIL